MARAIVNSAWGVYESSRGGGCVRRSRVPLPSTGSDAAHSVRAPRFAVQQLIQRLWSAGGNMPCTGPCQPWSLCRSLQPDTVTQIPPGNAKHTPVNCLGVSARGRRARACGGHPRGGRDADVYDAGLLRHGAWRRTRHERQGRRAGLVALPARPRRERAHRARPDAAHPGLRARVR